MTNNAGYTGNKLVPRLFAGIVASGTGMDEHTVGNVAYAEGDDPHTVEPTVVQPGSPVTRTSHGARLGASPDPALTADVFAFSAKWDAIMAEKDECLAELPGAADDQEATDLLNARVDELITEANALMDQYGIRRQQHGVTVRDADWKVIH